MRLSTILEVAHQHNLGLPVSEPPALRALVQVCEDDAFTSQNFLSKFETLRLFYRSPDIIRRITRETIADAAADNVQYMELRFTPVALSRANNYPLGETIDWVVETTKAANKTYAIDTRLLVSINRHESTQLAEEVAHLAVDRMGNEIVGLDLAGDEANFSALPFAGIFREARQAGLRITVHAGEWGEADNIVQALEEFNAERIGHGVRVLENARAVALAKERGTTFEVCPTSNYQSGIVNTLGQHPLPHMLDAGLNVTLNTDDPGISDIVLSDEFSAAHGDMALSVNDLRAIVQNGIQAAFLKNGEIQSLTNALLDEFPKPE